MSAKRREGTSAESKERQPGENFCSWDTREERERARCKFENSRKHCSGKPAHARVHVPAHIFSKNAFRVLHGFKQRAGRKPCDPSARRSEINYGVSGACGTQESCRGCDTSLEACRGFVSWTTGPCFLHGAPIPRLNRTNLQRSKTFEIRGDLKIAGLVTDIAKRIFISCVTWRIFLVTIAVYSYDYGYGSCYRYTPPKVLCGITRIRLLARICQKYDGQ